MKVVINKRHGGFRLSEAAIIRYAELAGLKLNNKGSHFTKENGETFFDFSINRTDSNLVTVIEELGEAANGYYARLSVVEVPDDVKWHIAEYDGSEWVAEDHRTWE